MMLDINNNPWLGLSSYQTADSFRFFGREREMEEIGASIKDNYCTILYGVSGAGKTSIINAGLCPKLAREGYVPITIRFDHNGPAYSNQIIEACLNKFKLDGIEFECPFSIEQFRKFDERDVLWLFFHTATFWSNDNQKIVPVLFIDQFEELFTLTKTDKQIESFFQQIDSLFGSVPSERLISSLESENVSFEFSEKSYFRIVLSMREDFLARLEDYCYDLPILRRNRIGLRKMNGLQALDVIMKPDPGLITKDVALKIVSEVTGKNCSGNSIKLQLLSVDTSILSLFCAELYKLAAERSVGLITPELVDAGGGDIIKRFYEKNISKLSRRGRKYLEQHLLTSNGFRNQLAVEDINHSLLSENDIKSLESTRIIRKEIINGTARIEFTHDILCKAASESISTEKERKSKFKSVASYSTFIIICIYIVCWLISSITFFLIIAKGRLSQYNMDEIDVCFRYLGYISILLYGLVYLPLSLPASRKKNLLVDITLILWPCITLAAALVMDLFDEYLHSSWLLWVWVLTVIPVVSICSGIPRCSFREYRSSIFKFSSINKDKWTLIIFHSCLIYGSLYLLREFHYNFLFFSDSKVAVSVACLLASILIVTCFTSFISVSTSRNQWNKKNIGLSISQILILFIFLLTQYCHGRWASYLSFASLIIISLYSVRDPLRFFYKDRNLVRLACCLASFAVLYYAPNYISNVNILSLNENARSLDNRGCYHQAKIVSPDGYFGVMEGTDIIIPPVYKSIQDDGNSNHYSLSGRYKSARNRLATLLCRIFVVENHTYIVRDDNGIYSIWSVMEHPEMDNKYTRSIPRLLKNYPTDSYIVKVLVDYYYHKAIVKGDDRFSESFHSASQRLFILNYEDENKIAFEQAKQLELLKSFNFTLFSPSDPNIVYDALRRTLDSKAIKSDTLQRNISTVIENYTDENNLTCQNKCKALLCLIRGEYDEAVKYAKMSFDNETLACALVLSNKQENLELVDNLLIKTNDDGLFLGEIVAEDIEQLRYTNDDITTPAILNKYSTLPHVFKESKSLDLTRVRRTLHSGRVLFIEKGDVVSRYDKIVYPNSYQHNSIGVYFRNGKRGYIDSWGNELTGTLFDHAWLFSDYNDLAVVEVDGKIGFINTLGIYTVAPSIQMQGELRNYKDWIFDEDGFLSFPGSKRKFGLLDSNGKWVVCPQFGDIGDCYYGFREILESNSHNKGLLDKKGAIVIQPKYQTVDVDSKYIEVRDSSYVISYFKHDGGKILGKVLERE